MEQPRRAGQRLMLKDSPIALWIRSGDNSFVAVEWHARPGSPEKLPWAVLPGQGEPRPGPTAPVLSRRTNQPEIPPTAAFDLSNRATVRRSVGAWGDRARLYLLRAVGSDIDQVFAHKQRESGAGERQVVSQFEM